MKKHGIHAPSVHEQDLSVSAEEVGNVRNLRNISNVSIQNKCIDMENVHDFVDESRHPSWAELCVEFENLQKHKFEDIQSMSNITRKLVIKHSEEILNVRCLEYSSFSWARSVLANDLAIKWAKARVCVCADSVLCVGQMNESKEAIARWEGQVEELKMYPSYKEL